MRLSRSPNEFSEQGTFFFNKQIAPSFYLTLQYDGDCDVTDSGTITSLDMPSPVSAIKMQFFFYSRPARACRQARFCARKNVYTSLASCAASTQAVCFSIRIAFSLLGRALAKVWQIQLAETESGGNILESRQRDTTLHVRGWQATRELASVSAAAWFTSFQTASCKSVYRIWRSLASGVSRVSDSRSATRGQNAPEVAA